jgi:hypothetical protein
MLKHTRTAILSLLAAALLLLGGTLTATADTRLPDATGAGFADKLYRLACERRVGLDPWRKCWTEHRILVDLLADTAGKRMVTLGYGCS